MSILMSGEKLPVPLRIRET